MAVPEIDNQLGKARQARGLSAAELAHSAGVSRQTIHAIEAGNYIPNAVIALRLARALDTSVEDLFRLAED
ncbi:MAG: helix-turn-helix transcriptional regulator, partial [Acidobacteriota bacterium]|nr:helix-turn-helix transcriptional regulator [Acidobacteriota bacterium]